MRRRNPLLLALCGGMVFNVANLLLVAAIDVAGLAVAFPVGIGLALVVGSVWSYLVNPKANPLLLFGGVALVVVAIVLDAAAYRKRESEAKAATTRGIVLEPGLRRADGQLLSAGGASHAGNGIEPRARALRDRDVLCVRRADFDLPGKSGC